MKTLLKIMGGTLATIIIMGSSSFAQNANEENSKNPLKNKRNYKTSIRTSSESNTLKSGSLVEKETNRDYKKSKSPKKEYVVSFKHTSSKKQNYKMPH